MRKRPETTSLLICLLLPLFLLGGCTGEQKEPAKVGEKVPEFSIKDIEKNTVKLSDWADQPIIIRFWETDCMFCRADTPVFVEFYNEYKAKGLNMIYVGSSNETLDEVHAFIDQFDIDFHVAIDPYIKFARLFGIKQYPMTYIISPDHIITAALPGGVGRAELDELVGIYFNE